ncbi:MAG: GAF domain-containing protein [Thermodesulfobacteriota bacterium]|nr:GAF domain-containing protein [Thermodesulfobacteriota bacterium]
MSDNLTGEGKKGELAQEIKLSWAIENVINKLTSSLTENMDEAEIIFENGLKRLDEVLETDLICIIAKKDEKFSTKIISNKCIAPENENKVKNLIQTQKVAPIINSFQYKTASPDEIGEPKTLELGNGLPSFPDYFCLPLLVEGYMLKVLVIAWKEGSKTDLFKYNRGGVKEKIKRGLELINLLITFAMRLIQITDDIRRKELIPQIQRELKDITQRHDLLQVVISKVGTFESPRYILIYLHQKLEVEAVALWIVRGCKNDSTSERQIILKEDFFWGTSNIETVLGEISDHNSDNKAKSQKSFIKKIIIDKSPDACTKNLLEGQKYSEYWNGAIVSIIAAPVIVQGKVRGVLALYNKKERKGFSPQELDLLKAITNPISLLFKYFDRLAKQKEQLNELLSNDAQPKNDIINNLQAELEKLNLE